MGFQVLPDSKLGINWTEEDEMSRELKHETEILFVRQAEEGSNLAQGFWSHSHNKPGILSFPNTRSQDLGKILSYLASLGEKYQEQKYFYKYSALSVLTFKGFSTQSCASEESSSFRLLDREGQGWTGV